jgi:hypothetical protein
MYTKGDELVWHAGKNETYNTQQGPEHANISSVTNTKLNITIKEAETLLINVTLGLPLFRKRINV